MLEEELRRWTGSGEVGIVCGDVGGIESRHKMMMRGDCGFLDISPLVLRF